MSKQKQTIIFIVGLGHSGSTMLSALLSCYKNVMAMGEVYCALGTKKTITTNHDKNRPCTCGKTLATCPIWSKYLEHPDHNDGEFTDRYKILLKHTPLCTEHVIVDSSKNIHLIQDMKLLSNDSDLQCHIVFLVKDIRSWVASMGKQNRNNPKNSLIGKIRCSISWFRTNRKILKEIQTSGLYYTQISYEQLCADPDTQCQHILSQATHKPMGTYQIDTSSNAHLTYGNAARHNMQRLLRVTYDITHLQDFWIGVVTIPFFWWNKKIVYKNTK